MSFSRHSLHFGREIPQDVHLYIYTSDSGLSTMYKSNQLSFSIIKKIYGFVRTKVTPTSDLPQGLLFLLGTSRGGDSLF